ncbi:MAG: tryptophan--tRNA ligase [Bacteroidetes bacterium]|nr:tryptophan--tRNA ligase [Bacteroidota bacterium]
MAKVLTGVQSSGSPHLGNILGAILPAIENSKISSNIGYIFIADLHTLTSIKDPELIKKYVTEIAAAWLAFGLDTNKNIFFRQSRVIEVCELKWYLECFTPYPMLANAHSFKDKSNNLSDVNSGLFTYPVLMAADILIYDAEIVPVGKDQKQHLEITRDIAKSFNHKYGDFFVLPKAQINEKLMTIPGIDGRKMSKSYGNTINIFLPDKELKKTIMSIKTDSIPLDQPKNPETCNVFKIYSLLANDNQISQLKQNYLNGNYGYGNAKKELFTLILDKFSKQRIEFDKYIKNKDFIEKELELGESKAREIAQKKINAIRKILKYN